MSIQTEPTTDVRALLNHLKETFAETFRDVSSAKDMKKMIDRLMNHFPPEREQELLGHFSDKKDICKLEPTDFRSIRDKLAKINESLPQLAGQTDFKPLSGKERTIIDNADKHPLLKCLRVSYEFCKHSRKICLFLAIFPAKAVLRKSFLIYWWIGEGLVPDEEEGERALEELLDLELLIPYRTDKRPRVSKFQIFPWIRYMLISVAMKEKLLSLKGGKPQFDPICSWNACLIDGQTKLEGEIESTVTFMRTIFNVNERDLDFQHQWLAKLKNLVVLQLGRWQVSPTHHIEVRDGSFLTGLKTQKLLKYLSLRGISRITALPDSIKELVSLEILDLKACHNLETLPDGIASLRKLTHLDVSECCLLDSMPKGLDKLTSLQVLKGFIIGSSLKTPSRIKHLQKSLKNLKRLSIHIGSEASIQKDEFDELKDFKKLKCLKISWGKEVKEGYSLSFPEGLQKLDLEGIPHEKQPEWLRPSKLRSLETLCIKGGKLKNLLDEGGQWNNVKYLVLKYTNMEQITEETLESVLPSLQYVKKVEWVKKGEQERVEYEWNKG